MESILRNLDGAKNETFDVVVIGAGIYGVSLAFEASKRGLRALLMDKGDFGEATSFNSLRTIHGGFRYLQTMDFKRLRESILERRWFLKAFPHLVHPMPCLMPLYGDGLRKVSLLRVASALYNLASRDRNHGLPATHHIPDCRVLPGDDVESLFPLVERDGLRGGVEWYDACVPDSQRNILQMIRWACRAKAVALNYTEARELVVRQGRVTGIKAEDLETGQEHLFSCRAVVNAAGPWCRALAERFHIDLPQLFRKSIAWNVLFDRKALSRHSVAVKPKAPGARTYFLLPWKGLCFAGTGHAPFDGALDHPLPTKEMMASFIKDINEAIPGLDLEEKQILRIFPGLLPARKEGSDTLSVREEMVHHGACGGPQGFYSLSGVKFTTARWVAEQVILRVISEQRLPARPREMTLEPATIEESSRGRFELDGPPDASLEGWKLDLKRLIEEESVLHLDDLILRRTTLWEHPQMVLSQAAFLCDLFQWNEARRAREESRLREALTTSYD